MIEWQTTAVDLAGEPLIPLALVKRHARIFGDDDDDYLGAVLIPAAIATVQRDTRWRIMPVIMTAELPPLSRSAFTFVTMPAGPFVSAIARTQLGEESPVTIDGVSVRHDGGHPGSLRLPPVTADHDRVLLDVRVGDNPPDAAIAILIMTLVAHWFEHPEAVTADGEAKEVPLGYRHLVQALDPMGDGYRVAGGSDS